LRTSVTSVAILAMALIFDAHQGIDTWRPARSEIFDWSGHDLKDIA
jgi:hypothetical protein